MSTPRTLRFAVTGSLLATTTLGLGASACVADEAELPASARDAAQLSAETDFTETEGSDEGSGDTVVNPGPHADVGGPVDPEALELATPPPPPTVNPGRVDEPR